MNEGAQPTNGELLAAIVALHAFTETGLQRLDRKIDDGDARLGTRIDGLEASLGTKIERLEITMNRRFDRVYDDLDELKARVTRLEVDRA
jgi:hypothetical protein